MRAVPALIQEACPRTFDPGAVRCVSLLERTCLPQRCTMRASMIALGLLASAVRASPLLESSAVSAVPLNLTERCVDCTNPNAQPDFANDVPSCAVCAPQWPSISSCAAASSVFKDASQIMWCVQSRRQSDDAGIRCSSCR